MRTIRLYPALVSITIVSTALFCRSQDLNSSDATNKSSTTLAVLPFSPVGISSETAEEVSVAVEKKLAVITPVISHDKVMAGLSQCNCNELHKWNTTECVKKAAATVKSDFILSGSIGKAGSLIICEVTLYDVKNENAYWVKEYQVKGLIEDFIVTVPERILQDIPKQNFSFKEFIGEQTSPSTSEQTATSSIATAESIGPAQEEPRSSKQDDEKRDVGIVKGFTIGLNGLFSLGQVNGAQSPAGFRISALYPTSPFSQIRLRAGVPLFSTNRNELEISKRPVDPYVSLEHDWGWKNFGIGFGLSYMYLNTFRQMIIYEHREFFSSGLHRGMAQFDGHSTTNIILCIRGGQTRGGFFGRVAAPLMVGMTEDRNFNVVFEYSAHGAYGFKKTKLGFGTMGFFKRRSPDSVVDSTGQSVPDFSKDYKILANEDSPVSYSSEFFWLLPDFRFAQLVGQHVIISLTLEIGGIIIPRIGEMSVADWRPSLGCDFVFSFGKLTRPSLFDGTF